MTDTVADTSLLRWQSPVAACHDFDLPDASSEDVEAAVATATDAFCSHRHVPVFERIGWLMALADHILQAASVLETLIVTDIGKPRKAARFEVRRGVDFVRACAAQLHTLGGETLPLDASPAGAQRVGYTMRKPYGVVAAVTPFNAPLNLLVQKIVPALAMGNAVIAKPHPAGTRVAQEILACCARAGLPPGLFQIVTGDRAPAQALAAHAGVHLLTFTGGVVAGQALARLGGAKKLVAELGSNSANVVLRDADLPAAARKIAAAAFEASGQQCVSAQRVIVEACVHDEFTALFCDAARALRTGDPGDETVDIGPMISESAARRVIDLWDRSVAGGATVVLQAHREGAHVSPGVLGGVAPNSPIWCEEVFGPLVVLQCAQNADHAIALANDSPFGLQGAVFTRDLVAALDFADRFEVGALWINEASRFRLDNYPFGGAKASGFGREGVRFAMEEMAQLKFIGIARP